jgi:TetR/AcrR family transcriptional regulator, regulator of biofilm formation and stress response
MAEAVDQRRVRGERRRAELIEATLAVIEREGVGGVSHRAVAKLAGTSPTAAIHHFATLDDLLLAAVVKANEDSIRSVEAVEDVQGLADLLAKEVVDERSRFVALFELYLLAARRPALRPEAYRWIESVEQAARRLGADHTGARALTAALDGLGIQALLTDEPPDRRKTAAVLRRTLS